MRIHLSSLSSFIDDGCPEWYNTHNIKMSLLGSLANDRTRINEVLSGSIGCCEAFLWDCGAISNRNKKSDITLEAYVEQVEHIVHGEIPLTIVGLDVIGDAEASQKNYMDLKNKYEFGNNFLPVFHYGEDLHYLEFLLKEGFTYIGLGGVGAGDRLGQSSLRDWLASIFFENSDGKTLRYPNIKFHGFAITSEKTLPLFPFYSVDSATWVKNSAIGKILTPFGDFRVSDDHRSGKDYQHIKRVAKQTKDRVINWVESLDIPFDWVVGENIEPKQCRLARHIVNTNYFKWIENNHKWEPKMKYNVSVFSIIDKKKEVDKEEIKEKIRYKSKMIIKEVVPTFDESDKKILEEKINGNVNQDSSVQYLLDADKVINEETVIKEINGVVIQKNQSDINDNQIQINKGKPQVSEVNVVCPHCFKNYIIELKVKKENLRLNIKKDMKEVIEDIVGNERDRIEKFEDIALQSKKKLKLRSSVAQTGLYPNLRKLINE